MDTICASWRPAHRDTSAAPGGRFIQSTIPVFSSGMHHRFGRDRRQSIARTPPNRNALYNPASHPSTIGGGMAEPTYEGLKAKLAELEKQGVARRTGPLEFRVGEKGGVSVYGLGRFPVTLYFEQWIRLLETAPQLRTFLEENKASGKLKLREK